MTAFDAMYNASTPSDPITVITLPDTTAPSTPGGLKVDAVTASKVLHHHRRYDPASTDTSAPTSLTLLSAFDGGSSFCPEELWIT